MLPPWLVIWKLQVFGCAAGSGQVSLPTRGNFLHLALEPPLPFASLEGRLLIKNTRCHLTFATRTQNTSVCFRLQDIWVDAHVAADGK